MPGSLRQRYDVLPTSPVLRSSTQSDAVRYQQIARAIDYAARTCTVNERPLYALLRRAQITLSNYSLSGPPYPPEVSLPLPWEPQERELS